MAFAIDSAQKAIRDRIDFWVLKLPVFDPALGTSIRDGELDARLEELTTYFTVFSFIVPRTEVRFAPSIEAALTAGEKEFCLIQNAGHLFFGQTGLARDLHDALERCTFLMGDIRDRGGYFYLDDQCILLNRRAWEKLGRPPFGLPHVGMETVAIPAFTAEQDRRVNELSPTKLAPLAVTGRFGYGWNAVSASLDAGLPVRSWPAPIAQWHQGCGAYLEDIGTWRGALLDSVVSRAPSAPPRLKTYLDVLCTKFMADADHPPVFVFNSEADVDLPVMGLQAGVDTAFLLAAGFKSNRILETVGFHDETEVVFYDYSAAALALKRMTVEEWEGVDFGSFFQSVRPRLEDLFARKLIYMQPDSMQSVGTLNKEFQAEMRAVFNSQDQWLAHWRRFRALRHHYIQLDLIDQPDTAREVLARHGRGDTVLWVSDMFNAPYAVGKFAWPRRMSAFTTLTETLDAHAESYLLLGGAPALWRCA